MLSHAMRLPVLLLCCLCSSSLFAPAKAHAARPEGGCFAAHLEEAIELNRARRGAYARASDGRSELLSHRLLASEEALLPCAWVVDALDELVEDRSVCDAFEPMANAPVLVAKRAPPRPPARATPNGSALSRALRAAERAHGLPGLRSRLAAALRQLEGEPAYHCMTRHVLESVQRAATLVADRSAKQRPTWLAAALLEVQLYGLPLATSFDEAAQPLQRARVPILCRDVPPVPVRPSGWMRSSELVHGGTGRSRRETS